MTGVDVHAATTCHIEDGRQIPLLEAFARGGIVEALAEQGTLLDGIAFHARTVGVYIAENESVAMLQASGCVAVQGGIDSVAACPHLVAPVAIAVEDANLVELGTPRTYWIAHPSVAVMPVGSLTIGPIKVPSEHIAVVVLVGATVFTLHDERRVNTVQIGDAIVSFHRAIARTHIVCPVVASIGVTAIRFGQFCVFQFVIGQFSTCCPVDDGDVERRIALSLCAVVDDAIAIDVARRLASHIGSPRLIGLIPETCAVGRADNDLALAVAVDVVGQHHVVLSRTDIHVGTHIDSPQKCAIQFVCLNLVAGGRSHLRIFRVGVNLCRSGKQTIDHHCIIFAIAVQIHWPDKFGAVVVALNHLVVEVELKPHVGPRLGLVEERIALLALHPVHDGGDGILGVVGQ